MDIGAEQRGMPTQAWAWHRSNHGPVVEGFLAR
jgi:hypothetical protein